MMQSCKNVTFVLAILFGIAGGQFGSSSRAFGQIVTAHPRQSQPSAWGSTQEYNKKLEDLAGGAAAATIPAGMLVDYRIGSEDLLEISVYGAPDLDRTVRVGGDGSISLPLIGEEHAEGLTAHELERQTADLLEEKFMNQPEVSVFVKEAQNQTVSVIGAVEKPGVFQIRGPQSLVEVLSMAQGLADDAGDRVVVMRQGEIADTASVGAPDARFLRGDAAMSRSESVRAEPIATGSMANGEAKSDGVEVSLKDLIMSSNPRYDITVYPGDVVKVPPAGIVYVVGQVKKPGGFLLKTNQGLSVLQALALAEGTTSTSAEKKAKIIRTEGQNGKREEIPINLKRILAGKAPDLVLQAKDILFVPNSAGKAAFYRGAEAAVSITGGLIVYRSW